MIKVGDYVSAEEWNKYSPPQQQITAQKVIETTLTRNCQSGLMITLINRSGDYVTIDSNWLELLSSDESA